MELKKAIENDVLVSIVIPTFNRPLLARRAIASVLAQTIKNIEVIVVDDSSNKKLNVPDIINSIDDKRIIYISHTHSKGPSSTRNTGIASAKGKYIALLDDDDIWFEDKIERQLNNLNGNKAGICAFISQKGKNKRTGIQNIGLTELRKNRDWAICSGLIILAEIIKKVKFDNKIRVGEDMDLLFSILKTEKICYLDEVLFIVNAGEHHRITNEGAGDSDVLEKRVKFIKKNMASYGKYWGNVSIATILLRDIKHSNNKINYISSIYKRCGAIPTTHVMLKKTINALIKIFKK